MVQCYISNRSCKNKGVVFLFFIKFVIAHVGSNSVKAVWCAFLQNMMSLIYIRSDCFVPSWVCLPSCFTNLPNFFSSVFFLVCSKNFQGCLKLKIQQDCKISMALSSQIDQWKVLDFVFFPAPPAVWAVEESSLSCFFHQLRSGKLISDWIKSSCSQALFSCQLYDSKCWMTLFPRIPTFVVVFIMSV